MVMASSFKNSLPKERIREIATLYFIPPEVEITIPRMCDDVLHPLLGFCFVYVDHLKVSLCLSLFLLLVNILDHYHLTLSQLVPNG